MGFILSARKETELVNKQDTRLSAPRVMIIGFIVLIVIGMLLLALPASSVTGRSIGLIDALFIATSAVCVTGLSVLDVPGTFTTFGELVLLVLIQIGGLGFMVFGVLFAVLIGKKIGLRERLLIQQSVNSYSTQGVIRLALNIFIIALIIETFAACLLTMRWMHDYGFARASYYGAFHAISAFNNAGFALWPDNLTRYVGDPTVNLVISALFIFGGLGFTVILDIIKKRRWKDLSLHSKIVIVTNLGLIAAGTLVILAVELFNPATFGGLTWPQRLWAGYFQGVVTRTAGFNTIDIGAMLPPSQFFMIFLMFIGGSSGSTAGGIKTNTFAVLLMTVLAIVRGKADIQAYKRRLAVDLILRSLAVIIISLGVVMVSTFLLTMTEYRSHAEFLTLLFEATSAFGTVGMTMDFTGQLSVAGKAVIIVTMFIGRLGPLTLAFAMTRGSRKQPYRYPEEKILIG
ncbi:Ktr system potassium transporter B [Paenibacillus sp. MWE-103]|uniref:Ktr system potassium transporter B n=1 Tax=Paenibacillus artemisiicola TaxID=1172618 RepID=A0ABS3WBP6_9BACL|nr:TrkH family potassium uptake protein [Paenibacillus artemisiicola]MBO7745742.1 Ktr system potassium transporter B [Paenibacillus artemisiicola]